MEKEVNLLEKSQRLRYEAFSVFAAHVNKANDINTIGEHLTSQIKFILDAFILQIVHTFQEERLCLEIYRGRCNIIENPADRFILFQEELLKKAIPVYLSKEALQQDGRLAESIFNHDKTVSFYSLPILIHEHHHIVISIANKETSHYTEVDFRFVRLICDLLSSKLSQLSLIKNIENKNQALARANDELVTLNEQVRLLNLGLEKKVEERTSELKRANDELQTIFYRTSHDFRRPLTSILGLVQIAELTTQEESIIELLDHCKSVVLEMDGMLTKLSILSNTDSSEIDLQLIDFHQLCINLYEKFREKIEHKAIHFEYNITTILPFYSDATIIGAIVENLVENAIYFHSHNPYIKLQITQKENNLAIHVIDNGQGIEEEIMDKIFNMYYRANDQSKGNGLGLYVVKNLVKLLQGQVEVESKKFAGSTFTVILPYLR